jgi:hypothetical protein
MKKLTMMRDGMKMDGWNGMDGWTTKPKQAKLRAFCGRN